MNEKFTTNLRRRIGSNVVEQLLVALPAKLAHNYTVLDLFLKRISNELDHLLGAALVATPHDRLFVAFIPVGAVFDNHALILALISAVWECGTKCGTVETVLLCAKHFETVVRFKLVDAGSKCQILSGAPVNMLGERPVLS
jgi:hypothetical protein